MDIEQLIKNVNEGLMVDKDWLEMNKRELKKTKERIENLEKQIDDSKRLLIELITLRDKKGK